MKPFEESLGSSPTLTGEATKAIAMLTTGAVLGNYRIIRLLGAGGMGAVYLVEHIHLKTRHALKTIRPEFAKQQNFAERFQREAKLAMRLKHPHIVACTETGVAEGIPYLVMDYIEGPTGEPLNLRQLLDQRRGRGELLDEDEAAAVGLEICKALDYAHSYRDAEIPNGIIHRDLKPANILLDKDTKLYIADFGLARMLGGKFEESVVQALGLSRSLGEQATLGKQASISADTVGTLDYMSPEQREGRVADERSDVFAMGVILYELLTGRKVVGVPTPPSVVRPGLNPVWDDIILEHALAYDPAERYASAGDFCKAIEGVPLKSSEKIPPLAEKPASPPTPEPLPEETVASAAVPAPPSPEKVEQENGEKPEEASPGMAAKVMSVVIVLILIGLAWLILRGPDSSTGVTPRWTANLATSSVPINAYRPVSQIAATNPVITPPLSSSVTNAEELRRGLVLYFSFDNIRDDQVLDDSGAGNHGNRKYATTTAGVVGSALAFDNDDAIVTVPNHPSLNPGKEVTLAAWIKGNPLGQSRWARIIDKYIHTEERGCNLYLNSEDRTGAFSLFGKNGTVDSEFHVAASGDEILDNEWHHLVGTFDGTILVYYLDGYSRGASSFEGQIVATEKELTIGNGFDGNIWFPFKGLIDEVTIFNRALSGDEVKQLYDLGKRGQSLAKPATLSAPAVPASPTTVATDDLRRGLVLYFSFDNIRGDQVLDDSGVGNHGTRKNTTVTFGVAGNALDFDGNESIVTVPHNTSLPDQNMTLAAWVRGSPNQPSMYPRIVDKYVFTQKLGFNLIIWNPQVGEKMGGFHVFRKENTSEHGTIAQSDDVTLDDCWHHLVGSFDGTQLRYYVDGFLRSTTPCDGPLASTDKELTIGNGSGTSNWLPFKGSIDEVAIFNRALSDDEVKQLYELGKRGQSLCKPTSPPTDVPATSTTGPAWVDHVIPRNNPSSPQSVVPVASLPPEIQDLFTPAITALPADARLNRVLAKLKELNPAFHGNVKPNQVRSGLKKIAFEKGADITNLWPLRSLASTLTELHCRSKSLEDLTPLAGMQLNHVDCAGSRVSDLSPLRTMKSLRTINCCGTRICDLSPLQGLPLRWLGMNGTKVADLTPLAGMPLEFLGFPRTAVTDLSVLKTMPKLRKVKCDFMANRDAGILRSIRTLEEINDVPVREFWARVNTGDSPQAKPDEDDKT